VPPDRWVPPPDRRALNPAPTQLALIFPAAKNAKRTVAPGAKGAVRRRNEKAQ